MKFGRHTTQISIPEDEYSSGMMSFLIANWNGPQNGPEWNASGISHRNGHQ